MNILFKKVHTALNEYTDLLPQAFIEFILLTAFVLLIYLLITILSIYQYL